MHKGSRIRKDPGCPNDHMRGWIVKFTWHWNTRSFRSHLFCLASVRYFPSSHEDGCAADGVILVGEVWSEAPGGASEVHKANSCHRLTSHSVLCSVSVTLYPVDVQLQTITCCASESVYVEGSMLHPLYWRFCLIKYCCLCRMRG